MAHPLGDLLPRYIEIVRRALAEFNPRTSRRRKIIFLKAYGQSNLLELNPCQRDLWDFAVRTVLGPPTPTIPKWYSASIINQFEYTFLKALQEQQDDKATMAAYADWLLEHDDFRGQGWSWIASERFVAIVGSSRAAWNRGGIWPPELFQMLKHGRDVDTGIFRQYASLFHACCDLALAAQQLLTPVNLQKPVLTEVLQVG